MARTKFLLRFQARFFHGAVPQQVEQSAAKQPEGRPHQGLETGRADDGGDDVDDEGLSHVAGQEGKGITRAGFSGENRNTNKQNKSHKAL